MDDFASALVFVASLGGAITSAALGLSVVLVIACLLFAALACLVALGFDL